MSRKDDLEESIRESYRLIREYEDIRRLSSDPKERARAWRLISEQQGLIETYVEEYVSLCQRLDLHMSPDILEIIVAFSQRVSTEIEKNAKTVSVLFLAADPTDASRLRLGEEFREIEEQLTLAKQRERFDLKLPQFSLRPRDVSRVLLNTQPQIVHFSGHGTFEGALCFESEAGRIEIVQPDALAALFREFADQVKCVLLNACYSEIQSRAIAKHINYVIGMSNAISDRAAIAFALGFYQALGAGREIEDAYRFGCVQIRLQGIPEHLIPVLIKKESLQS